MKQLIMGSIILLAVFMLAACNLPLNTSPDAPSPTQPEEELPTPTHTTAPVATATATPTPTLTPEPTPTPTLAPGDTSLRQLDDMVMVYVPQGEFTMGMSATQASEICYQYTIYCEPGNFVDEEPVHPVYSDAFWIDQTEVTVAQYARCLDAGVCQITESQVTHCVQFGNCGVPLDSNDLTGFMELDLGVIAVDSLSQTLLPGIYYKAEYENHPVVDVTWEDARTYCEWVGARLPSEAEWEKAARGTDGRVLPWGNETLTSAMANFDNRMTRTTAVGSYPADTSPYGALDMAGNVTEWVADFYADDYYDQLVYENPPGPDTGNYRVLRGGSWYDVADGVRVTNRSHNSPQNFDLLYGFRCASDVQP